MSEALLLFGKRGQGKTLYAVSKIREYLLAGRVVATNLDLDVVKLVPAWNKTRVFRVPDFPTAADLKACGYGNPDPVQESKNGLLVLDEAAAFLNSRSWNDDKGQRLELITWLAQSRKFGWDLLMIAQHPRMIDAQVRDSLFELFGSCIRIDKMMIPFVSRLGQWLGVKIRFPKAHRVAVRLGADRHSPLAEHVLFTGKDLYAGYDTLQKIDPAVGVPAGAGYFLLSAWERKGRYLSKWVLMRKVIFGVLAFGFAAGVGVAEGYEIWRRSAAPSLPHAVPKPVPAVQYLDVTAKGTYVLGERVFVALSDGRTVRAISVKSLAGGGREFEVEPGKWVKGS